MAEPAASCAADGVTYSSGAATVAITAALSAALGSLTTAYLLRRLRPQSSHDVSDIDLMHQQSDARPNPNGIIVEVEDIKEEPHLRVSTATTLTASAMSNDWSKTLTSSAMRNDGALTSSAMTHDDSNSISEFPKGNRSSLENIVDDSFQSEFDEGDDAREIEETRNIVPRRSSCPNPVGGGNKASNEGNRIRSSIVFDEKTSKKLQEALASVDFESSDVDSSAEDFLPAPVNPPARNNKRRAIAPILTSNTKCASLDDSTRDEERYISDTEFKFKGQTGLFDASVHSVKSDLSDALVLLRRYRAISALSSRLMAAPDEKSCIEEVTHLLAVMFRVERASFAMLTGEHHFVLRRVNAFKRRRSSGAQSNTNPDDPIDADASGIELEHFETDYKRPLKGTAAGVCIATMKEHYTPRTSESQFATHKIFFERGFNTVLCSPILVNGNQCAGCILLSRRPDDGFPKSDRVLISDIGLLLGANIYAKRLLHDADEQRKRSREMLHSFIPPKVLMKIECYWDENSDQYKGDRHSLGNRTEEISSSRDGSVCSEGMGSSGSSGNDKSNLWFVANPEWNEEDIAKLNPKSGSASEGGVKETMQLIKNINRLEDDRKNGLVVSNHWQMNHFSPTSHALYAKNEKKVCIIFTDIVGFSRISLDISPIKVMDMLQNLYNRFDELCDVHGVLKLETIGDAYICATNLMEDDNEDGEDRERDAAVRALAMSKDMVLEARNVRIPYATNSQRSSYDSETLQIRVGIHTGDVTCGVLGQKIPKFTTCGAAVNMAARMEQTSLPSCIRVTKDFHDLVGDHEMGWTAKEVIELKNMGHAETYLLDPTVDAGPSIQRL